MPNSQKLEKALALHQQGQLEAARKIYQEYLKKRPKSVKALYLYGTLYLQSKNYSKAVEYLTKSLTLDPCFDQARENLASAYLETEDYDKAWLNYQKIIEKNSDAATAINHCGLVLYRIGKYAEAVNWHEKALEKDPKLVSAYTNAALALEELERYPEAQTYHQKALQFKPNSAQILTNLAKLLYKMGCYELAESHLKRAIDSSPDYALAYSNLGAVYLQKGSFAKSIQSFQQAVGLNPLLVEAYNNLGLALKNLGRFSEAIQIYNQALVIKQDSPVAKCGLGNVYEACGHLETAAKYYLQSLEIYPDFIDALCNLGFVRSQQKDYDQSLSIYKQVLTINHDNVTALNNLLLDSRYCCNWKGLKDYETQLDNLTSHQLQSGEAPEESLFLNQMRLMDPEKNYALASAWSIRIVREMEDVRAPFEHHTFRYSSNRIKIGYLSSNFLSHAMIRLLFGLLKNHNKDQFEIFCYSCRQDAESEYAQQVQVLCDHFVDISGLSHTAAAQRIYNDKICILVDLMGYTYKSRIQIGALRPAPVQIRYLGQAGTTGADFFDYLFTDSIVTPESEQKWYTEKFVYLPGSYQINDYQSLPPLMPQKRQDHGLPEDSLIFCCFCTAYKIEPLIFQAWMNILREVSHSVLWLLEDNPYMVENLRRETQEHGLDPDRLIFAPFVKYHSHLSRLALADIALDTHFVNGAATTTDALWSEVPVITLKGTHFSSRISESFLHQLGLDQCVAYDLDEYIQLAISLATDFDKYNYIKEIIQKQKHSNLLFDPKQKTVEIEKIYQQLEVHGSQLRKKKFTVHSSRFTVKKEEVHSSRLRNKRFRV
jgi:protein O-GlcNAc transferase